MTSVVPLDGLVAPINGEDGAGQDATHELPATPVYFAWTGWLNRLAAAVLLVPAVPVIALLVVLTRLGSPGPGIYRQKRVGFRGQTYTLYKIRTMRQDAEAGTGPAWSSGKSDPRVTRLGRIMRALHLDELPQLYNVLRGEMNLIGPRPERPEFTQYLARTVPGYLNRLAIKPGITGLAQIQLPPDTDLDSVRLKLATDLQYLDSAGLWMDVRILVCTALRMFGIKGGRVVRAFGFEFGPAGIDLQHRKALARSAAVNGHAHAVAAPRVPLSRVNGDSHVNGETNGAAAAPSPTFSQPRPTVHAPDA